MCLFHRKIQRHYHSFQVSLDQVTKKCHQDSYLPIFVSWLLLYWRHTWCPLDSPRDSRLISFLWPAVSEERTALPLSSHSCLAIILFLRTQLAMFVYIHIVCHNWVVRLMESSEQRPQMLPTSYNAQDIPPRKRNYLSTNISRAKVEKSS